jgi:hypothetical protein
LLVKIGKWDENTNDEKDKFMNLFKRAMENGISEAVANVFGNRLIESISLTIGSSLNILIERFPKLAKAKQAMSLATVPFFEFMNSQGAKKKLSEDKEFDKKGLIELSKKTFTTFTELGTDLASQYEKMSKINKELVKENIKKLEKLDMWNVGKAMVPKPKRGAPTGAPTDTPAGAPISVEDEEDIHYKLKILVIMVSVQILTTLLTGIVQHGFSEGLITPMKLVNPASKALYDINKGITTMTTGIIKETIKHTFKKTIVRGLAEEGLIPIEAEQNLKNYMKSLIKKTNSKIKKSKDIIVLQKSMIKNVDDGNNAIYAVLRDQTRFNRAELNDSLSKDIKSHLQKIKDVTNSKVLVKTDKTDYDIFIEDWNVYKIIKLSKSMDKIVMKKTKDLFKKAIELFKDARYSKKMYNLMLGYMDTHKKTLVKRFEAYVKENKVNNTLFKPLLYNSFIRIWKKFGYEYDNTILFGHKLLMYSVLSFNTVSFFTKMKGAIYMIGGGMQALQRFAVRLHLPVVMTLDHMGIKERRVSKIDKKNLFF